MLLYLKQSNNSQCPSVSVLPITGIMVHIFNNSDRSGCSMDILIKPSTTLSGQRKDLCIQATHDESRLSEMRCYAVVYEESQSFQQTLNVLKTTTRRPQRTTDINKTTTTRPQRITDIIKTTTTRPQRTTHINYGNVIG
ncbi:uncharacterized protein LOC134260835 [Saccostrea cucullata]|uniref:uncharacterized protein LOC134260835 n=1 Tax=Saccostrea cuccullata TaxID=36930 RepID=UPI002ED299CA